MTHRQLRQIAVLGALVVAAVALQGCSNPWVGGPSAGATSFRMKPPCTAEYDNNGRDIESMEADFKCMADGSTTGRIRIGKSTGGAQAVNATNQNAIIQTALIAAASPALMRALELAAKVAAASAGVPGVPAP